MKGLMIIIITMTVTRNKIFTVLYGHPSPSAACPAFSSFQRGFFPLFECLNPRRSHLFLLLWGRWSPISTTPFTWQFLTYPSAPTWNSCSSEKLALIPWEESRFLCFMFSWQLTVFIAIVVVLTLAQCMVCETPDSVRPGPCLHPHLPAQCRCKGIS